MLEKPELPEEALITTLAADFALPVSRLVFLPIGADQDTAVYRAETGDGAYFLKLRRGGFDQLSLEIPLFLKKRGLRNILAPLATRSGQAWAVLGEWSLALYPFMAGQDGYETRLTPAQWLEFGALMRKVHTCRLPPGLLRRLPREDFSPRWRGQVMDFLSMAQTGSFGDPTAARLAAFMREKRAEIAFILARADELGRELALRPPGFVLCHCDVHPGNLLISAEGPFYLVDWDQPALAPRERDFVLLGGGAIWNDAHELEIFRQGYGPQEPERRTLAYYRYERVVQDLAVECRLIFTSDGGGDDREQEYRYFVSNFEPGHEIDLARRTEAEG